MKTINIKKLGRSYSIVNEHGENIRIVTVISHEDFLKATVGLYDVDEYETIDDYVTSAKKSLSGFVQSPLDVYWHSVPREDFQLISVIDECVKNNYKYAIIDIA